MSAMTVGELIEALGKYPAEMPVGALYDCRLAGDEVMSVELGNATDGSGAKSVLLILGEDYPG